MLKKILFYSKKDGIDDKDIYLKKYQELKNEILETNLEIIEKIEEIRNKENEKINELKVKIQLMNEKHKKEIDKINNLIYSLFLNNLKEEELEKLKIEI